MDTPGGGEGEGGTNALFLFYFILFFPVAVAVNLDEQSMNSFNLMNLYYKSFNIFIEEWRL